VVTFLPNFEQQYLALQPLDFLFQNTILLVHLSRPFLIIFDLVLERQQFLAYVALLNQFRVLLYHAFGLHLYLLYLEVGYVEDLLLVDVHSRAEEFLQAADLRMDLVEAADDFMA